MSSSEKIKTWRRKTKKRIVESMGGKCVCCGYNKCNDSLALHHVDSDEKDFTISQIRANPKSWEKIVKELKKCVLVCHNCHSEIHHGLTKVPDNPIRFNENYTDYQSIEKVKTFCPICEKEKPYINKTCSHNCAAKLSRKVDWDNVDLLELKKQFTYDEIGKQLGITEASVRKRYKKITKSE